ncbi:MAG: UvrB/UvrC motif-containing protein [Candidatus Stahlbacteria bacterium]|nr:UvrB/UvrC motif-containing protein [Candidatus Stahlbacteria bacterium]
MLCDICHKSEAVLIYTLVINNQKTALHLCEHCATKRELINSVSSLGLTDFISLISYPDNIDKLKCPRCGLTYRKFISCPKFGCSDCYKVFEKEIAPILRRLQGSDEHIGKMALNSSNNSKEKKVLELRKRLKDAIAGELYEEAARIRDELKKLKSDEG